SCGYFKSRIQLQLEIVSLRKQLEILTRTSPKPRFKHSDRLFFNILTDIFGSWKETLLIIKPETVIRWHRQGFRLYWRWKSRSERGRPKIPQEQINLIKQIANENPLWGAPRIHGELLKLGFDISESTVLQYLPKKPKRTTGQHWKTFLKNHSAEIISIDFLVVPTITFRLLYVLVFLSHDRRKIIHVNVTDYPTSEWASQQSRSPFYDEEIPKFLIWDRDEIFGEAFTKSASALGIRPILTAYRSPWQNGYVERVIGGIRRECLDHLIILSESLLRNSLRRYVHYYSTQRTHLGVDKDSPEPREVQADGEIGGVSVANGQHHFYFRRAA
ncbi:MAG: integrase core domain-containing protein, partial [Ignavibacteriales bacterium]|nr:integrase core domain-containing protein [Ignavibacteriales bacterium]